MAFLPTYSAYDELQTIALDYDGFSIVEKSPNELMQNCLEYYGLNLRVSKEMAKEMSSNKINMSPVLIPFEKPRVWIPTRAFKDPMLAWLSVHDIMKREKVTENTCKVLLRNGTWLDLHLSKEKLVKQMEVAYKLYGFAYIRYEQMHYSNPYGRHSLQFKLKEHSLGYSILD